jgi:hypothetical protein
MQNIKLVDFEFSFAEVVNPLLVLAVQPLPYSLIIGFADVDDLLIH